MEKVQLTAREEAIAQRAAEIAVEKVAIHFYAQVGRGVLTRLLVWIGMGVVGFLLAKGWVKWPN